MSLSGRTISRALKAHSRASQTSGKDKGITCTKSALKEFGRHANPYKLSGDRFNTYLRYCQLTNGMNK